MCVLLLLSQLVLGSIQCDLHRIDGQVSSGQLVEWQREHLVLETESGSETVPIEQILQLDASPGPSTRAVRQNDTQVELVDGSQIVSGKFEVESDRARIALEGNHSPLLVHTKDIHFVRFGGSKALKQQWDDLLAMEHEGDVIVIRRSATSLDYLEGVVRDVSPEQLEFEFEGDTIDVQRKKLEGIIFYQGDVQPPPGSICHVVTSRDRWQATRVELVDSDRLLVITPVGVEAHIGVQDVVRVRFDSDKLVYLSDREPASVSVAPLFGSASSAAVANLLFAPRRDQSLWGKPLSLHMGSELGRQSFEKGWSLHSRTEMQFRLGGEFRRLRGFVGIDPRSEGGGSALFLIQGDGKELLRAELFHDAAATEIDVDLEGVKRLTILVDYGDNLDIGDHVNLCDLRVTK